MPRWGERMDQLEAGLQALELDRQRFEYDLARQATRRLPIGSVMPTLTVRGAVPSWSRACDTLMTTSGDILYASGTTLTTQPAIKRDPGQGMTRGYWRGGKTGRHPGYR